MFWVPPPSRDSDQKILNLGDCVEKTQEEIQGALRITWPRKRKGSFSPSAVGVFYAGKKKNVLVVTGDMSLKYF